MPPSEVTVLLEALSRGEVTLGAVERDMQTRNWPREPVKTTQEVVVADAIGDAEPPIPGSFFDVSAAASSGLITPEQYAALARAYASATAR